MALFRIPLRHFVNCTFAAFCLAAASSTVDAATGSAEAETKSRTGRFTLMAFGGAKTSDFAALTHRYDLMVTGTLDTEVLRSFRQHHPGALVLYYFNTLDVNADSIKSPYFARLWNDTNPREDWFHHDAKGQRVRVYFPKYKNRYALNTGHPKLQEYLASRIVEILRPGLYDGIHLDNVTTDFPFAERLVGKWISAVAAGVTPQQWTADEVAMLTAIKRATVAAGYGGKTIIFNQIRSGEPVESRAYLAVTDGANCESWMSRGTRFDGPWGWKAKVDQVREANLQGKLTNLLCVAKTPSEEEALFLFASYLMALEGDRAYFYYGPQYRVAEHIWYPFYDVDLGKPTAAYAPRAGGFWRPFSGGAVAVNPTEQPVTISLPGRYQALDGKAVERLLLGPKEAAIVKLP